MSVVPLRPDVRFYCSDCDLHFYDHERAQHEKCSEMACCTSCGRSFQPGDEQCAARGGTSDLDVLLNCAPYDHYYEFATMSVAKYPTLSARVLAEFLFQAAVTKALKGA